MRSLEEVDEFTQRFLARHGMCLSRPFEDRAARRHLSATAGDALHAPLVRCHCPGVYAEHFKLHRCFLRATQEDAICDACRKDCLVVVGRDKTRTLAKAIDHYGPAVDA